MTHLTPAPGGLIWLARHDVRVATRQAVAAMGGRVGLRGALVLAGAFLALTWLARPAGRWLAEATADPTRAAALDGAMLAAALLVLPWVASHALTGAVRTIYARGDLDLLLTSPLPPRRLLAARALAICLESTLAVGLFLTPLLVSALWFGGWRWLALAPTLVGLGLIGSAAGFSLALALFALVGPRLTRFAAQAAAMSMGLVFVVVLQALHFLPEGFDATLAGLAKGGAGASAPTSSLLLLPAAKAAQGDLASLALLLGAGGLAMGAAAGLLGTYFVRATMTAAGAPQTQPATPANRPLAFRAGAATALRLKEWRLLLRDQWLLSHLAMQALYTLPIAAGLWRLQPREEAIALLFGPTSVIILSQLAASLAWVAVSSEDAPDLMASAPVAQQTQRRRKLEALAAPLALLLAPVLFWIAQDSLRDAAIVGLCALAGVASTTLANLQRPQNARRSALGRRYAQSKIMAMVEHFLAILWGMACLLALQDKPAALALVALAGLTLWLNRPPRGPAGADASPLANRAPAH
jgi:ABC-2 type transport system permease protein